jgi:glycosyltransferase involved in cell wall biosynthesis
MSPFSTHGPAPVPAVEDSSPRLRVRTVRRENHHYRLGIDLGQRNAVFVTRTMTLRRFVPWTQAFGLVPEPGYDLVHSVNAVPLLTRRPYVISYENYLPRVPEDKHIGWLEHWLQRRLLSDVRKGTCLALLAMSEYGRRQFRWQNRSFNGREEVESRMEVLYPSIDSATDRPKSHSPRISLLFVGFNFIGKGGPALLRAHARLRSLGLPVDTTIVSSLQWSEDDFLGPPSQAYVEKELRALSADGITHHRSLPNDQVLSLMRASDYFVLPTLHDTFGYVAVEALSRGTPVIATNTCAIPEIIDDGRCGFLLPFERDDQVGRWRFLHQKAHPDYLEHFDQAIEQLAGGIVDAVSRAWEQRLDYENLSAAALDRVRNRFSRTYARDRLEEIYELARISGGP